jgi:hypothetical protein
VGGQTRDEQLILDGQPPQHRPKRRSIVVGRLLDGRQHLADFQPARGAANDARSPTQQPAIGASHAGHRAHHSDPYQMLA